MLKESTKRQEHPSTTIIVVDLDRFRNLIDKNELPWSVTGHFQKCTINGQVNIEALFEFFEQWSDVLSSHRPSLFDVKFLRHGLSNR
jgi:hypothetical protein